MTRLQTEEVIAHEAEEEDSGADGECGDHFEPGGAGEGYACEDPEREEDEDSCGDEAPIDFEDLVISEVLRCGVDGDDGGEGDAGDDGEDGIGDERASEEEVGEACDTVAEDEAAEEDCECGRIGFSVGIEGHSAGDEGAEQVDIGEESERGGEAAIFC